MAGVSRRAFLLAFLMSCLVACGGCARPREKAQPFGSFSLTERSGREVTHEDLHGKVWIASFIFTRCTQGCPQISSTLAELQKDLASHREILLVSFTVDPEHDNEEELQKYAENYGADSDRWLFLTGSEKEIAQLHKTCFGGPSEQNEGENRKPGNEVNHNSHLVLVDRQGRIRGLYDGFPAQPLPGMKEEERQWLKEEFERNLKRLHKKAVALVYERWYLPTDFPRFNASLNALCIVLLMVGYLAIRRRFVRLHIVCMLSCLFVSALFLASYLFYHLVIREGQATRFAEQAPLAPDWVRYLYLGILLTHTILAAVVAPLALYTAYVALRGRLNRHTRIARWTLPIWLYVSVTGVVVYFMLYRLYTTP